MDTVTAQATALPAENEPTSPAARQALEEILEQHRAWLASDGDEGHQADLCHTVLAGSDLTDANLRNAHLDKAILRGADLLLADLQGASLLQAHLEDANLLGTKFQEANLQGASLDGATGLLLGQLAGANLFDAALPTSVSVFEGLKEARKAARSAGWLLAGMLALNGLAWLRIATTADAQLLKNAAAVPVSGLQRVLPLVAFYLFSPMLILCLYVYLHLYLQRLWEATAAMPAILPDGRRLDTCVPWFARWAARRHFRWLREKRPPLSSLETGISVVLLYWVVPATLVFFWGRFLTLQDMHGSLLQVLLVVGAAAAALYFPDAADKAFQGDGVRSAHSTGNSTKRRTRARTAAVLGTGLVLSFLTIGTILGAPHDYGRLSQSNTPGIGAWAADVFWMMGYDPYPHVIESDISTKPPKWTGRQEEISSVEGANLNRVNLRYVQAYGAFLIKAHLWLADLRNAYLSEADLRQANLRQAILRDAVLDRAKLNGAILQQADLQKADLTQADLREANLSFASLAGAILLDAKLDGANFYRADLRNALLQRASLEKADLREANLEDANLAMGNLREAFLDSAKLPGAKLQEAQLTRAMLMDANLRGADFSRANLQGTILRGADLSGANLQGADLRGALGLNAAQICGAANLRQVQLDEALQRDVDSQCGTNR